VDIEKFQEQIGIQFKQGDLLRQALTHSSYINEQHDDGLKDNERLEYLGDAVLDFVTADMLYNRFPDMNEGELTRLRSALVRTEALAHLATDCKLGEILLVGKGEGESGGLENQYNLCCTFEALIGAIFLDQGLEVVKEFVIPRLTELQTEVMEAAIRKDSRSQFQEWAQAKYNVTPEYRTISSSGPEHEKEFTVELFIGERAITLGQGRTKRAAAQSAARNALRKIKNDSLDT
jgi:ribonuclease III